MTPTDSERAEYLASHQALLQHEIFETKAAQKQKETQAQLQLRAECHQSTCHCWLLELDCIENQTRYCVGNQSSSKSNHTRSRHLFYSSQAYLPISTSHVGICSAICSNTSADQEQVVDSGRCLLIVYHDIASDQKIGGNLVQWRSSRQDLIAKSTSEAELIASSEALQQGENIAIVVAEMTNKSCEIEVSSVNAASLHMIRNGSETAWRTRHRGIKFTYQPTAEMAADSLAKGLGASRLPQAREDFVSSKTSMSWSCSKWFHSMSFRDCLVVMSTFFMSRLLTENLGLNRSVKIVYRIIACA